MAFSSATSARLAVDFTVPWLICSVRGDLGLGQVRPVAQHQHLALARREALQRHDHLAVLLGQHRAVLGRGRRQVVGW